MVKKRVYLISAGEQRGRVRIFCIPGGSGVDRDLSCAFVTTHGRC